MKSRLCLALLLLQTGCIHHANTWWPSRASDIPDGTPVRYAYERRDSPREGKSVGWQSGRPRMINATGDTIAVPDSALLEVKLPKKEGHPLMGGIIGIAAGIVATYATCAPPKKYCGEQNPSVLLGATLGAFVGSWFKTDKWVSVSRQ